MSITASSSFFFCFKAATLSGLVEGLEPEPDKDPDESDEPDDPEAEENPEPELDPDPRPDPDPLPEDIA